MTPTLDTRGAFARRLGAAAAILAMASALPGAAAAQGAVGRGLPVTSGGNILAPGAPRPPLGRAGPPGSFVAEIDIVPTCTVAMQRSGFYAKRVSCPPLATKPGLTTQCIGSDGRRTASAIATFIDFSPATGRASTFCELKSVIGG